MDAKDSAFLVKMNTQIETRKKIEMMKSKERDMQLRLMQQKRDKKSNGETQFFSKDKEPR